MEARPTRWEPLSEVTWTSPPLGSMEYTRRFLDERFGEPQLVAAVPPDPDATLPLDPSISGDGRTLFWRGTANRGGQGGFDIWMLHRVATTDKLGNRIPFSGDPQNLGLPVNSAENEFMPHISFDWPADGSTIYFGRSAPGLDGSDIYEATWRWQP